MENKISKLILGLVITVIGSLGISSQALAVSPQLLFSDMTDAPITGWEGSSTKGAAVSIYARNIGSTRGTSYVTVGGVDLTNDTDYAEWGATINPTVPLGMQRITFFLNSTMTTGGTYPNTTITITTSEGTTEAIPFHTRDLGSNHIYFVDNVGGNTASDGLSVVNAKRYLAWFRENATAGDILYVKGSGTLYTDHDDDTGNYQFANHGLMTFSRIDGTHQNFHNGEEGKSITVTAYPGDLVEMEAINKDVTRNFIRVVYVPIISWTFSKFKINALQPLDFHNDVSPPYDGHQENLRFINLDITTPWIDNTDMEYYAFGDGMDFYFGGGSHDLYILGSYFHDVAVDFRGQAQADPVDGFRCYFLYANGYGTVDNFEIAWNEFGWNSSSRGVQFYGHHEEDRLNNLFFHDNWIHDTTRQGLVLSGEGGDYDYSFVQNVYIYNNIINNTGTNDVALQMGGSYGNGKFGGNYYVYNNIFDGSNNVDYPVIHIGKELDSLTMKNNIIVGVPNQWDYATYFPNTYAEFTSDLTPISDHNLYFGAGAGHKPGWDSSTLDNTNPLFTNATPTTYSDFQLQSTSPAINAGTTIATVAKDFLGITRPQGAAYDIGAYEFVNTAAPEIRADVDQNGTINSTDAMLTLRNSLGLSMTGTNWQTSSTTGDVNCDGNSNSTDAMLILRHSLGLSDGAGWCE